MTPGSKRAGAAVDSEGRGSRLYGQGQEDPD